MFQVSPMNWIIITILQFFNMIYISYMKEKYFFMSKNHLCFSKNNLNW